VNVIYTASAFQAGNNPTYSWNLNGNPVGTNSPTYINNNPSSGDLVTCTVVSSNGCSTGQTGVSNSIPVTVISTPVINCSADSFFTYNPTYFNANVVSGGLAPFTYQWNFGNNSYGTGASVATVYTTSGNYNVQVNVTDANGCTGSCNLLVQIGNYFQVDFVSNKFNGCAPLQVQFTNQSINALTYLWDFGDGSTSNLEHPSHVYHSPGTYNVSLAGFSATGNLIQTVNNQIMVFPSPTANFLYYSTGTAPIGDTIYFADNSINAWSWDWNFGDPASGPLNVSNIQNPIHYYATNNNYTVTLKVSNNYGCRDSITKQNYVIINTSLDGFTSESSIHIYPNPFIDEIVITDEKGFNNCSYIIYNNLGQIVMNGKINSSKTAFHLPIPQNLPEGFYYLSLASPNFNHTIKLIHPAK
jgi:PKD repeat protein